MASRSAQAARLLAEAQAVVEQAKARQARWEAAAASKQAELADLESRVGAEVLAAGSDDQVVADRLTEQMTRLRSGLEIDRRAAQACQPAVAEAQRQVLLARQQGLELELDAARERQTAHDAKLDEILAAAAALDGVARFVPWRPTAQEVRAAGPEGVYTGSSVSQGLSSEVARLEGELADLQAQTYVPLATATASVSRRTVPFDGRGEAWVSAGAQDMVQVYANVQVTSGQGSPRLFELVVAGEVVGQVTLEPGSTHVLEHVVGQLPLQDAPDVEARVDGETAARLAPHMLGDLLAAGV